MDIFDLNIPCYIPVAQQYPVLCGEKNFYPSARDCIGSVNKNELQF